MKHSRRVLAAAGAATLALAGTQVVSGAGGGASQSVLVPMVPCRLLDTRPGGDNVGSRTTPLAADEMYVAAVHGSNGNCTVPESAVGVSANVTVVNGSAASFLTLFPTDAAERPVTPNLNWVPGAPPTPNKVDVALAADGSVALYNFAGTADVIVDLFG